MSYDFSIKAVNCNHVQTLERYVVSPYDNRTLLLASDMSTVMRAPLNGVSLVKLYIGGVIVPPGHERYGWTVSKDTTSLSLDQDFFKIQFNQSMRMSVPLIEVTYRTYVNYCLRCNGTGFVNDYRIQNSGNLLHIWGQDKLVQRSLKWILTSTCGFYPQLVCHIKDYIGKKYGMAITDTDISQEVMNAMTNMKNIQQAQMSVQSLSDGEILVDIQSVTAQLDPTNPTLVRVSVNVVSGQKASNLQAINFSLRANK